MARTVYNQVPPETPYDTLRRWERATNALFHDPKKPIDKTKERNNKKALTKIFK